tara:strand:+ start:114 stop:437 length:324 start_codon:yes stop_codon:yes gene_type:complete
MPTIVKDKKAQSIVLGVNILSFANHQVKIGKVTYDMPNPRNLGPQSSSIAEKAYLVPCQKNNDAGTPKSITVSSGLSDHHFQTHWALEPNHIQTCPPSMHKHATTIA